LGPTADDITKPVLTEYFGGKLIRDEVTYRQVMEFFESRGLPTLQRNVDQSLVPDVCTVLHNTRGTAPGMWFEKGGKIYVSMPGVPHEMKGLMEDHVLPKLRDYFNTPAVIHQTLITSGMGESFVAERLVDFEAGLPLHIKLAYLPAYGLLKLRLTAQGADKVSTAAELSVLFHQMKALLTDIAVADQDISMAEVIGRALMASHKTVGTAESCTGGYISHSMTLIPGSSAWYSGSIVSYSNEMKMQLLGVKPATLNAHGAVSEQVVLEMAAGALQRLKTDYIIAVSGIMGPDGGTPEKPVGTVWIAAGSAGNLVAVKFQLRYDRYSNIQLTAAYAMNELRKLIV
jgi:nicotinamide-nucleotide amidase